MRRTTDLEGRPAVVAETAAEMRTLGHVPRLVSVHGMKMWQCGRCGARLGSFKSGRPCPGGRSRVRPDELTRGMGVIVKEGSPLRKRFGIVNRLVVKPGGSLDEDRYLVRVAQPGGGWRTVEFRRGDLRHPEGGRPRRKRGR